MLGRLDTIREESRSAICTDEINADSGRCKFAEASVVNLCLYGIVFAVGRGVLKAPV